MNITRENHTWSNLLWIDCIAGGMVGIATLSLSRWLDNWYGLPQNLIVLIGIANLLYASYSFSLALLPKRLKVLIRLLIAANLIWAVWCLVWAFRFHMTASVLGLLHLVLEALFVGGLAGLEWRWREALSRKRES
jgi:hypothetical protein